MWVDSRLAFVWGTMVRTTSSLVQGILGGHYDSTIDLTPFIDTATAIVDRVATCAANKDMTLTAAELELIERWLAGHFYERADQMFQSRSTSSASGQHVGQTGMHLESTYYGQTAMDLDYSGCLTAIGKRQFASLAWLGKAPSAQTDYVDRD